MKQLPGSPYAEAMKAAYKDYKRNRGIYRATDSSFTSKRNPGRAPTIGERIERIEEWKKNPTFRRGARINPK